MTSPSKLNEFNHAEEPARELLERLGWTYVPRDVLAAERGDQRDVLLKGRLKAALMRLNQWMTDNQADRVIFKLEHIGEMGITRNKLVHEYLTYGMSLTVDTMRGHETPNVRFFDFDHPDGGLNEYVVTTQFRVRRSNERGRVEDDERMVLPDLVLFVNGIPLVVMEAKSPSPAGHMEVRRRPPTTALSGGGTGVAGKRRAGAVPLQPDVRRPLRRGGRVRCAGRAGERLLRVEVYIALLR